MSILGTIGTYAADLTPYGAVNAVVNKATGGNVGFDPTPGYSAQNVITTQAGKLTGGSPGSSAQANPAGNPATWGTGAGGGGAASSSSSAGGGGGSAYSDPYAAYGGADKYNALINGYNAQSQGITDSASNAANAAGAGYQSSILDYLDSLRQGQGKIDNQAVQNELAKQQATQGVLGMVGRGIRSGGTILANKNASDSSAAQAIADAYGQLGRQQLSGVGGQYAQGQNAIQQSQADLDLQRAQGARHLDESKLSIVNNIVGDARQKLASLDAQIAGANLPNRIAIQQQQDQIKAQALGALQQYDQQLAQGSSGIQASSQDTRRAQAADLANQGQAATDTFSYNTEAPAQFQGTGPFSSDLPLFSLKNKQYA